MRTGMTGTLPIYDISAKTGNPNYFSSNQGQVFIGPYVVDEVVAIGYKLQQSKVPVYGYASQYFDAVAEGKVFVSGFLQVNYIDSNYLYAAMEKYSQNIAQQQATLANAAEPSAIEANAGSTPGSISNLYGHSQSIQSLMKELEESMKGNPMGEPNIFLMKRIAQSLGESGGAKDYLVKALRQKFWGMFSPDVDKKGLGRNMTIGDLGAKNRESPFDETLDAYLARPDQLPAISITVAHGDPLDTLSSTYRIIRGVHFQSVEQNIPVGDDPQTETYTFFARTVEF